jgi:membrane protein YdbS with pleckstrin-like domain
MIPTNTAIAIGVGTLMVIVILVTLMTGSIFAAAVVVALIVLLFVVMVQYGFLHVKVSGDEIDIFLQDGEPKSIVPDVGSLRPLNDKEVFNVSDNRFT